MGNAGELYLSLLYYWQIITFISLLDILIFRTWILYASHARLHNKVIICVPKEI